MNPPRFYIETSVWGSLGRRQPHDRKQLVLKLLRLLDHVAGIPEISDIVLTEIAAAPTPDDAIIRQQVHRIAPVVHPIDEVMVQLANAYVSASVLPARRLSDALHVAAATCLQVDYLVSWNHRHMTRPMKRLQYESVNRLHGYRETPLICNPFEACDEI